MFIVVTGVNAVSPLPGSQAVCALREADGGLAWRHEEPTLIAAATLATCQ